MTSSYITDRAVGELPLSIATSMAIESAIGLSEGVRGTNPPILQYQTLWINLRTLFRNLYGSITTELRVGVAPDEYGNALYNEMDVIRQVIASATNNRISVVFYLPSYAALKRKFTKAIWLETRTTRQIFDYSMEVQALQHLQTLVLEDEIHHMDLDLEGKNQKGLIMTSYPVDLLSRYKFGSMSLLESHTGSIKPPVLWYTKLRGGRDLKVIPFDRMTLQLFGDTNMFAPAPIKIRRHVIAIGEKSKWTPSTTRDYILRCIRQERDPVLETYIKDLYSK